MENKKSNNYIEIKKLLYKLSVDALMLFSFGFALYFLGEIILTGIFSAYFNFFFLYLILFFLLLFAIMLGNSLAREEKENFEKKTKDKKKIPVSLWYWSALIAFLVVLGMKDFLRWENILIGFFLFFALPFLLFSLFSSEIENSAKILHRKK